MALNCKFPRQRLELVVDTLPHLAAETSISGHALGKTDVMLMIKYNRNEAGFTLVAMALVPMCTGGERLVR